MKQEVYQDQEPYYEVDDQSYLYDWVFHYNPYSEMWAAVPREIYNEYFQNYNHSSIIRSSNINTLTELLHKSKGDTAIIEKIVSGQLK
jgi:hypothetical protein